MKDEFINKLWYSNIQIEVYAIRKYIEYFATIRIKLAGLMLNN